MNNPIVVRCLDLRGDFRDPVAIWHWFLECMNKLPVSVLATIKHDFPGGGITGLVAIAESHAAIHTWPEDGYAWVELATCGDPSALDAFEAMMTAGPAR